MPKPSYIIELSRDGTVGITPVNKPGLPANFCEYALRFAITTTTPYETISRIICCLAVAHLASDNEYVGIRCDDPRIKPHCLRIGDVLTEDFNGIKTGNITARDLMLGTDDPRGDN